MHDVELIRLYVEVGDVAKFRDVQEGTVACLPFRYGQDVGFPSCIFANLIELHLGKDLEATTQAPLTWTLAVLVPQSPFFG